MTDRTDGIAERDWIPGEPAGDGIIGTLFAIIGGIIVTAIINAVFLYCCYDFLGKRSIADAYFRGDPPFPIDAVVIVLALVILPILIGVLIPMSDRRDRTTLLAIRARRFGRLKVCPDWKDSDGNTESRGINRILFHAADAGTIRVYAENGSGPVFLILRLDNGRMRVEDKQPVDAALLYEAEHGGGDRMDLFLDPRCSYRATGHSSTSNCLIVRQSNLT